MGLHDDLFGRDDSDSEAEGSPRETAGSGSSLDNGSPAREAPVASNLFASGSEEDEGPAEQEAGDGALVDTGLESDDDDNRDAREEAARKEFATGNPIRLEAGLLPPFRSDELHVMRTSNILNIEPKPFDPELFREEEGEDFDAGRIMQHLNVVRWRYAVNKERERVPQSNARMVRWDDGTWTLMIGEEALDVSNHDITANNQFLFVRHQGQGSGQGIIQGQAKLVSRMGFQPVSLKSKSHLQLKAHVERKHKGNDRLVQRVATVTNPERELEERGKAIEMRNKGREVLKTKQDRSMRKHAGFSSSMPMRLNRDYLEADDDDDDDDGGRYNEDMEAEAEQRILNAKKDGGNKRRKQDNSEDERGRGGGDYKQDSDDDTSRHRKKRVVLSSDDDE